MLGLAHVVELLAQPRADLLCNLGRVDRRVHAPVKGEESSSWRRSASTADCMSGYCSLQASWLPSRRVARCTWPSDAAAAGLMLEARKFPLQSGPSSAAMRRFTNGQPMGGASLCSFTSSAAYSAGSASGMVAISWATFMIGPLRPPSAVASSAAFLPRSSASPNSARPQGEQQRRSNWLRRAHSAPRGR